MRINCAIGSRNYRHILGCNSRDQRSNMDERDEKSVVTHGKVGVVVSILVIGTVSAIIFHYAKFAFVGNGSPFPFTFLHAPSNIFSDFYSIFSEYVTTKYAMMMNYFPAVFIPLDILARLSDNNPYDAVKILLAFYVILLCAYVYYSLSGRGVRTRLLVSFSLIWCSYPILFTLHTANFEMLCFLLVAYGVTLNIKRFYRLSGVFIGLAAAIKVYPIIFALSLINRRSYVRTLLGVFLGGFLSIVLAFTLVGHPEDNLLAWIDALRGGMDKYRYVMLYSASGVPFSHSLYSVVRVLMGGVKISTVQVIAPYLVLIGVIMAAVSLFLIQRAGRLYTKILLPLTAICVFVPVSQDYKLIYFTIPLLLIMRSRRRDIHEFVLMVAICLLMIPKDYLNFYDNMYWNINIILNASLLLFLFSYGAWLLLSKRSIVVGREGKHMMVMNWWWRHTDILGSNARSIICWTKSRVFTKPIILTLLALIMLFSMASQFVPTDRISFESISYASPVPGVVNSPDKRPVELFVSDPNRELVAVSTLNASLRFRNDEPTFSYGNLFQTGNSIRAFRLELQPANKLVMILPGQRVIELVHGLKTGVEYQLAVHIVRDGNGFVSLNGKSIYVKISDISVLLDGKNVYTSKLFDDDIFTKFDIGDVVVGSGMNQRRQFIGSIRDFSISAVYSYQIALSNWSYYIAIGLALVLAFSLIVHPVSDWSTWMAGCIAASLLLPAIFYDLVFGEFNDLRGFFQFALPALLIGIAVLIKDAAGMEILPKIGGAQK